jgi:hypothetical protein
MKVVQPVMNASRLVFLVPFRVMAFTVLTYREELARQTEIKALVDELPLIPVEEPYSEEELDRLDRADQVEMLAAQDRVREGCEPEPLGLRARIARRWQFGLRRALL